jgi:hypothetical protein
MWQITVAAVWIVLAGYVTWYIVAAKDYVQMDAEELLLLWKIHKDKTGCKAKTWKELRQGSRIIGFECECGHRHVQKRLITLRSMVL